ncbi:MAG: PQQ-binding-like beta-propeller repeat protein [Verrucomicrobiota bacterium]
MKTILKRIFLALVLLFGPVCLFFITAQGMTAVNWALLPAFLFWFFLFGIWYLVFGRASAKTRFLRFFLVLGSFFLLGLIGSSLLRYEGSSSGSSFPKFAWVWESEPNESPGGMASVSKELSEEEILKAAENVLDFLGPDRDGMWDSASFSTNWSDQEPQLLWKRPIGKAWSSFVVHGGQAITQEQAGDAERVSSYALSNGELIWHHDDPETRLLLERAENSGGAMGGDGPRATPVIHKDSVFSLGATGILNCLDLNTGEKRWSRQVVREFGRETQRWGLASSPLLIADLNIVVVASSDVPGATLVAFDLTTGEDRWVFEGQGASYSSPRILEFFGQRQIVSVNAHSVTGLAPETGKLLWRYDWRGNLPKVGQPLKISPNRILATASYGVGSPLLELSRDGENWSVTELWKSTRMKTKFSSAAIVGEYAYGLDEGRLACIDLASGGKVWKKEKFGFGQHLLFGDHLLVQTESGEIVMGRLTPEAFEETGRIPALSSMTWNVPTVAGRVLLVRNDKEAAAYLLP